jgi:hypothetical protein
VRDYRAEVCLQNSDGSFQILRTCNFRSLDAREARVAADIWLANQTGVETGSHLRLFMGSAAVASRPLNRRVWETLAS